MMVKKKKISISQGQWKDIRVRKETAKLLMQFKLDYDQLTYDDAINLMHNMLENKK